MSKKKKSEDLFDEPPHPKGRGCFTRCVMTGLVVGVVLYIALFLALQTAGMRSIVADKMSRRLAVPVEIGSMSADLDLDISLGEIAVGEDLEGRGPDIFIRDAKIDWSPAGWLKRNKSVLNKVRLGGCEVLLRPHSEGGWSPRFLDKHASWLADQMGLSVNQFAPPGKGTSSPGHLTANRLRKKERGLLEIDSGYVVSLEGGRLEWQDGGGQEVASVEGIDVSYAPLRAPARKIDHYRIKAQQVRSSAGRSGRNLDLELLRLTDEAIVLGFQFEAVRQRAPMTPAEPLPVPATVSEPIRDDEPLEDQIRSVLEDALR